MAAADRLPWPRAFEPSPLTRRVIQLLTLPPIIFVGLPLSALWNTLTYLYRRPPISLRQHLVIGALRFFQATANYRCVYPADPNATLIPKVALAREGVEYGARIVPPIRPDIPVMPCLKLNPAMQLVTPAPTPVFAIAPKGQFDDVWAKAGKDEMCIFYVVGGGYQVGHPLNFPMSTEYSKHTGLRLFSPNYRKCIDDAGGYPAPLYDMLAGIQFVLEELEFEPRNIIFMGESGGGHGILMVARYIDQLRQTGFTQWGLPGGIFASSPWTNALCNFPTLDTNYSTDWLAPVRRVIAPSFARHCAGHLTNPILSPALAPDDGHWKRLHDAGVAVHVDCGSAEVLQDDARMLVRGMRAQGLEVQFREFENGVHCEFALNFIPRKPYPGAGFSWPLILQDLDAMVAKVRARAA